MSDEQTQPQEELHDEVMIDGDDSELSRCEEERDKYKDGWQRAVADYHNLQKEVERQKSEWALWSKRQILEDFLPIYTNFKTAFAHRPGDPTDKSWTNWADGIGYIMKQFGDVLRSHAVEEIKTVGEAFDPAKHEAVGEEASDAPEHTIIREVETGYMMSGKVIKVAKVIVAGRDA